ncbi:MAG: protein kinase [Elusimicrobia bacterium]|nr:protein kinase [Elusimicrobiota bacterium]
MTVKPKPRPEVVSKDGVQYPTQLDCANGQASPELCSADSTTRASDTTTDANLPPVVTGPIGTAAGRGLTSLTGGLGNRAKTDIKDMADRTGGTVTRTPSGQTPASTPVAFPPASNPETEQARQEVARLVNANDTAAAREYAVAALARHPEDPALQSFVKLTAPVKTAVDQKTVKSRIAELAAGMRQDEGTGNGAILASPISFGALAGGASRGPAAMPAGLTVPDLRGNAVLRDASGKIAIKDYAGAEGVLTRRIAENPNDAGAFSLRALTRRYLTRFADSAEDAKRAVELNPRDSRSLHLLSRDLTDLGRPKEAVAAADRALALDNNDPHAYVARAVAYGAMGRGEEQLADLARAAALDNQFDALYQEALAVKGGGAPRSSRSWPVWLGAVGTALLFFSFALFRKRGDSSVRMALRKEDHDAFAAAAPRVDAVPKGFRVVKTLGQGGMGVVYEAVDLGLQRTVALKKLRPEVSDNPRERQRFLKEARTVAALKHPNIVEIHAIHEDSEGLFIVFERVPGETLHELIGRGPANPAEIAAFLKQIASALDYAHGQGVVHQDLKPANVMIHAGQAKVMDFGIARRVAETMSTMSKIEVAGTPAYMSPEQEQGVVTPSADVFALGACAYESLTGVLPFPMGGLMLKAQKMYRKPSEATPSLKAGVDAAIARALEPRPEDRWPSASSFVDALSRALVG